MTGTEHKTMKVVAKQLYNRSTRLYFAENDEHYDEMRKYPGGTFGCPECGLPFKKPFRIEGQRRHFAFMPGKSCDHLPARTRHGGGGGPMSPEHKWLQNRLLVVCRHAGHEAIPEHRATDSDLYVPSASYAIEVQRWPTNWKKRTQARISKGAKVIWLITDSMANHHDREQALFNLPCVRVRVHALGDDHHQLTQPWDNKSDNRIARLSIWATVGRYDRTSEQLVSAGYVDAIEFFKQILSGQRAWFSSDILRPFGLGYGAWVLRRDLEAASSAAGARREAERRQQQREQERLQALLHEANKQPENELRATPTVTESPTVQQRPADRQKSPTCEQPGSVARERNEPASADRRVKPPPRRAIPQPQQQPPAPLPRSPTKQHRSISDEEQRKLIAFAARCVVALVALIVLAVVLVRCSTQPSTPEPGMMPTCPISLLDKVFRRTTCDQTTPVWAPAAPWGQ